MLAFPAINHAPAATIPLQNAKIAPLAILDHQQIINAQNAKINAKAASVPLTMSAQYVKTVSFCQNTLLCIGLAHVFLAIPTAELVTQTQSLALLATRDSYFTTTDAGTIVQ